MTDNQHCAESACTSRRNALAMAGGTVLAGALVGCGTYGQDQTAQSPAPAETPQEGPESPAGQESPAGGGGPALAQVADIPVGGGAVFADQSVVVTQPEAGTILAFSAACTHQGCTVTDVADGTINCACHGSQFDISDGSVTAGPATSPLPEVGVNVDGDAITLA